MGYDQHPIGMTMQFPVPDQTKVNDPLFNSPADWISPGFDDEIFRNAAGPALPLVRRPAGQRRQKVIITDTDHYAPGRATRCGPGSHSCAATTRS